MRRGMEVAYARWQQEGTPERNFGNVLELVWRELVRPGAFIYNLLPTE